MLLRVPVRMLIGPCPRLLHHSLQSNPLEEHMGKWIFKGYLHGQNFVGRWREISTPWNSIGYEGGFVVYKTGAPRNL